MKNVILLGDSIRMYYQNEAARLLEGEAEVFFPDDNGRYARYTYYSLKDWLQLCEKPAVIHWNNGLWDTILRYDGKPFTEIGRYLEDMKEIYGLLKQTGARIIFATTTPVNQPMRNDQKNAIIKQYNDMMCGFFAGEDIVINDLYALAAEHKDTFYSEDALHPSAAGVSLCAEQVAAVIRKCL